MRDYKIEFEKRVAFIKSVLDESGAKGIVYGNSGGKDSALVGILCKAACDNTVGIILPCTSRRNYDEDTADAKEVAARYNIEIRLKHTMQKWILLLTVWIIISRILVREFIIKRLTILCLKQMLCQQRKVQS